MLKAWLRPWQVGRRGPPLLAPCSAGLKRYSYRPPLSGSHCSWWWWQSLSVSTLYTISIHHSLVSPPPLLSLSLTHSLNFSSLLFLPALSESLCQTSVSLRSCQAKKGKRVNMKNCPSDFHQVWLFSCSMRCEVWDSLSTFPTPLWCFVSISFWIQTSSLSLSIRLSFFVPSLPVRLSGILPRLFEDEQ